MSTTTLLHEAYMHMVGRHGAVFADRAHFLGYSARVMRGLLIDFARQRMAQKRGGQFQIVALEDVPAGGPEAEDLSRIGDALDQLAVHEPALAEVVDLRFFCGFSFAEIAALRGISERTAQREWEKARILLHGLMSEDGAPGRGTAPGSIARPRR